MRLIQRNLFPRRPPSAKCDGPSILKASSSSSSNGGPKPSPAALKALLQKTSPSSANQAANNNNSNSPPSSSTPQSSSTVQQPATSSASQLNSSSKLQNPPHPHLRQLSTEHRGIHHHPLPISKSASLSSLLVPRSSVARKNGAIVGQGSQDSFHVSDSSSPSLSLSSSSGSLSGSGGRSVPLHSGATIPPHPGAISRRSIVSRSEAAAVGRRASLENDEDDDDDIDGTLGAGDHQQQDCWLDIEKLVADHVGEILSKWDQIDDEIWAKVVVMERNRRVAKAYARTPVLTIAGGSSLANGNSNKFSSSECGGFNGHRVQLGAFANAHRDRTVRAAIRAAGDGLLVRMDEEGNLLGKRATERSEVSLLPNSLDLRQQQQQQGQPKAAKISAKNSVLLFDMAAFRSILEKEVLSGGAIRKLRSASSSSSASAEKARTALQAQCFVFLGFGSVSTSNSNPSSSQLLRTPVWTILVNLVALEMLLSSLPVPLLPHLPQTENFYSLPAMTSTNIGSSKKQQQKQSQKQQQQGQKSMSFANNSFSTYSSSSSTPPKLPPRDLQHAKPPLTLPEPDYDEEEVYHQRSVDDMADLLSKGKNTRGKTGNFPHQGLASKPQHPSYNDEDLYFLGYSAHVSSPTAKLPPNSTLLSSSGGSGSGSGSGNTSTASRSAAAKNPPIVRKKFWSQSGNGSSSHWKFFGSGKSSQPQPSQNNSQQIRTLDYRNGNTVGNHLYNSNASSGSYATSSSNRPSSAYYYSTSASQLLLPPYNQNYSNSAYQQHNSSSSGYADNNNSIYGVNTSLLRRTMEYQQLYQQQMQAMSRSVSSPSLRNIFFSRGGKKSTQKDFNNNHSGRLF